MGGGAIIFAVLTLLCAKLITIVSSSIVGSAMIVSSIDFFMHGLKTVTWVRILTKYLIQNVDHLVQQIVFTLAVSSNETESTATAML